jgi:hypothetical protein
VLDDRDARPEQDRVRRALAAALQVIEVDRVDADQAGAVLGQPASARFGQVGGFGGVVGAAPGSIASGVQQDRPPRHVQRGQRAGIDGAGAGAGDASQDGRQLGAGLQRQGGQIGSVRVAVKRAVQVGAGVADHADRIDLELGAGRVTLP